MQPHEAALNAAQAAQSAAIDCRDAIRDVERIAERFITPPTEKVYLLGSANSPGGATDAPSADDLANGRPILSTAIANLDAAIAVNVGYGGRSPRLGAGALQVPARRVYVLPWIVGPVEIDVEPGQAYPAGGLSVIVVRFHTVQPFSAAQI